MPKVTCTCKDCKWILDSSWCACPEIKLVEKVIAIPGVGLRKYHDCDQYKSVPDFVAFMEERGLD